MSDGPPKPGEESRPDEPGLSDQQQQAIGLLLRAFLLTASVVPVAGVALGPLWIVGLVALLCGILLAPGEASKEFYSAIAGTIPVLLLTLAVQARFFELPTMAQARAQFATLLRKPGEAAVLYLPSVVIDAVENATPCWRFIERILFGVALLALLMVGEFAALHPLATGVPAMEIRG